MPTLTFAILISLTLLSPCFAEDGKTPEPTKAPAAAKAPEKGKQAGNKAPVPDDHEDWDGPHLRESLEALGLSEEQRTKIREIRKSRSQAAKDERAKVKEERKKLEEMMKGSAKKAEIIALYDSVDALRAKLARNRFETMLEIREVLNVQQRKRMKGYLDHLTGGRLQEVKRKRKKP
jgi:Spy/CpxP family protein refolding chaperone